eukprot:scaffold3094_cov14-Tisochrysis_lutea.AAC.1
MTPGPRRSDHQPSTTLQAQASGYWVGQLLAGSRIVPFPTLTVLHFHTQEAVQEQATHSPQRIAMCTVSSNLIQPAHIADGTQWLTPSSPGTALS